MSADEDFLPIESENGDTLILQDNPSMDPETIFVVLVPLSLLIAEGLQRISDLHSPVFTFRKLYALIIVAIITAIAQFSDFLPNMRTIQLTKINTIFVAHYIPVEILYLTFNFNLKTLFRNMPILLMYNVLLIISAFFIAYLLKFLHNNLNSAAWMLIAVTMTTPQPQALIIFLAANDTYQTILNYLVGESLMSIMSTVLFLTLSVTFLIGMPSPIIITWLFFLSPCVGLATGWLIAKIVVLFLRKVQTTLEGICCVVIGMSIFMHNAFAIISFSCCGTFSQLAYYLVIASEKESFMMDNVQRFHVVVNFFHDVTEHVIFFYGMSKAAALAFDTTSLNIYFYCYLLMSACRVCSVMLMYPLVRRWEQMKFLHVLIFAMVCPTSNFSLLTVTRGYVFSPELSRYAMAHSLFNIIADILINNLVGINLLKWSHTALISEERIANMEVILHRIKDYRDECISNMMKDRTFAETNWGEVYKYARFSVGYPYPKLKREIDWAHEHLREYETEMPASCCVNVCPLKPDSSKRNVLWEKYHNQLEELVLMMGGVVKRMKEHCLISNECEQMLSSLLPVFKIENHDILDKFVHERKVDAFRKLLKKIRGLALQNKIEVRPRRRVYRFCFRLLNNRIYTLMMYAASLSCLFVPMLLKYPAEVHISACGSIMVVFFINFIVNIGARAKVRLVDGIRLYFSYFWGLIDVFALVAIVIVCVCSTAVEVHYGIIYTFSVLASLGSLRKLILIMYGMPQTVGAKEYEGDMHAALNYECAVALNACLTEAILLVERNATAGELSTRLRAVVGADKQKLVVLIARLRLQCPIGIASLMTQTMMAAVRCCKMDFLQRLKYKGVIDNVELSALSRLDVDVRRQRTVIPVTNPSDLFQNVYWMNTNRASAEFLKNAATLCKWLAGHELCRTGETVTGVYLLISGQLRLIRPLRPDGTLSGTYREFEDDLVTRGNSFGEIELLTGAAYRYTAVCEVDSRAYYIALPMLLKAMALSDHPVSGLEATLWKRKMLPLVSHILMRHPLYRHLSQWAINKAIQRAFVPNLRCYREFVFVDSISDLVLVYGVATNFDTNERFVAPRLIPRTCRKLILQEAQTRPGGDGESYVRTAKLLIIPIGEISPADVLAQEEAVATLIPHDFAACPYHVAQLRGKMKHRAIEMSQKTFTFSLAHSTAVGIGISRKSIKMIQESYKDISVKLRGEVRQ